MADNELQLVTGDYVESTLPQDPETIDETTFVPAAESPLLRDESAQGIVASFAQDAEVYNVTQQFQQGYTARDLLDAQEFSTEYTDLGEFAAAQFRQNNALVGLVRHLDMQFATDSSRVDPSFDATLEAQKYMGQFGSIDQQEYLFKANNAENFQARLQRLQKDVEDFQAMSSYGDYSNLAMGFISAAVDVDILIPGIQSYKLAKSSTTTAKLLNRLENAAKGARAGIAANAATGVVLAETNPAYTKGDMIADIALGGMLGSLIGGFSKGDINSNYVQRFNEDGSLDVKFLDEYHANVKGMVDAFDGQSTHSKVEGPFVTPEDGVLRSKYNPVLTSGIDPTAIKSLAEVGTNGIKKLSRVAADRLGKMEAEAQDFLTPKVKGDGTHYSEFVEGLRKQAKKVATKVSDELKSGDPDKVLPESRVKDTEVKEGVVEAPIEATESISMSPEALANINDTISTIHGKGLPQVENITSKGDVIEEITMKYPDGRTTKYVGEEAEYMASSIRTMSLIDTSTALNKAEQKHFIDAQRRFENELKEIREVYTDFSSAMKQKDSLVLRDFMLKIATSAVGNNTLTGMNAATVKNGVRTNLQQPFAVYMSGVRARGEEIMALNNEKSILKHNKFATVDRRAFNEANKEITNLVSDLNLQKSPEMINLGNDLTAVMEKYIDKGRLFDNEKFQAEIDQLATQYKQNKLVLRAAAGSTMTSWRSVDNMKAPPAEDINAGPVKGSEHLERSFYQPQRASEDIIQQFKRAGYEQSELISVFYQGYKSGLELKNPDMDVDQIDQIAMLHARSIVGRHWELGKTKAGDAGDFTKFTQEIDQYIKANLNLDDAIKEDLYQLKISLEADAATPSFLKSVTPFDRSLDVVIYNKVTGESSKMKAGDLMAPVNADTWTMYMNKVSGEVALASKGITSREQLSTIRKLIREEMNATGKYSAEEINHKLELFDSIKAQMLSEPNPNIDNSSASVFWYRAMKRALNLAVLNKLFIPQLAETAVVLSGLPIKRTLDYIGFANLSQQKKKVLQNNFRTLEELTVNFEVLEHFNSPQANYIEEIGVSSAREKVTKWLDIGEQAQRRLFFMNNVMNWQRKIAWLGSMETIVKSAEKSDWKVTKRMANQGITQDVLDLIKKENDNGRILLDKDGIVLNYDGVDMAETLGRDGMIQLSGVLQTIQDSEKILRPPVGQSNHLLQQPFISALTALKSYPLHAFNSLGLRHWEHKDKSTLALLASTAAFSYAAAYLKMVIEGKDTDELKMVEGMLKYNSLSGSFGSLVDVAGKTMDIDALKMSPDYGRNNTFSLPVFDYMNNLAQTPRVMFHAAQGDLTPSDVNVINGVGGFVTQTPFTAALTNGFKDYLKENRREERRIARREERQRQQQEREAEQQQLQEEEQTVEAEAVETLETFN